tara:strand:+ start:3647 stop:3868 length:222 start_codon:yes stop_codon:yes gene_type:complete
MGTYNAALERLEDPVRKARSALDYYKFQAISHCENHCTKQQVVKARVQADLNLIQLLASLESEIDAMRSNHAN